MERKKEIWDKKFHHQKFNGAYQSFCLSGVFLIELHFQGLPCPLLVRVYRTQHHISSIRLETIRNRTRMAVIKLWNECKRDGYDYCLINLVRRNSNSIDDKSNHACIWSSWSRWLKMNEKFSNTCKVYNVTFLLTDFNYIYPFNTQRKLKGKT